MTVEIKGNTYPVKDQLRALGGRWNAERKAWMVPDDQADAAAKLVQGAPKQPPRGKPSYDRGSSQRAVESMYRRRYGWDGVRGSSSYYTSGMYDEES